MVLNDDIARAICCEGQACLKPDACDAGREYRVPVSPHKAALAVRALLCREWAQHRPAGPMTRTRTLGAQDE